MTAGEDQMASINELIDQANRIIAARDTYLEKLL
jgi:hypothetical protein